MSIGSALRLALLALVALLATGCLANVGGPTRPRATSTPAPRSAVAPTSVPPGSTPTARPSADLTPAPTARPAPATPDPRAPIVVTSPSANELVGSPFRLAGSASVFEATLAYEVVLADGRRVAAGVTTASEGAPGRGAFRVDVRYSAPAAPGPATLRVFTHSPKDGSVQNLVEVPIRLQAAATALPTTGALTTVRLYFERSSGSLAVVERRIPATPAIGRATLEELLRGPTPEEQARGLSSPIPGGTRLLGLRIVDGTAEANFDRTIQRDLGGAERVARVRQVIEQTLKQFSTVQRVVILVEGRAEGALEP